MYWAFLMLAIVLEVVGTAMVKLAAGFTRVVPSVLLFVFYGLSFVFFTIAVKRIEVTVSYAIWSGLGTAMIAGIGFIWFREPVTVMKVVWITVIIVGVVGLQLSGGAE